MSSESSGGGRRRLSASLLDARTRVYLLALLALTGVVVLVMGRFETPRADDRPPPPVWKPLAAGVTVIAENVQYIRQVLSSALAQDA